MSNGEKLRSDFSWEVADHFREQDDVLPPLQIKKKEEFKLADVLFGLLAEPDGKLALSSFWNIVKQAGILETDVRLKETKKLFEVYKQRAGLKDEADEAFRLDKDMFKKCTEHNLEIITKIVKNDLVVPEFDEFVSMIQVIYYKCLRNQKGAPADYIPQLARMNPKYWGVAICTTDGQRKSFGDVDVHFCIQSCSKPLNYALAVSEMGTRKVHEFIGLEPSGRSFNELTLDHSNKPHNPMINAGAIITSALLKPQLCMADKFDYVFNQYKKMAGGEFMGFSNATYLSERETADRNFALGHYMRENKCFPQDTDMRKTLEFYFQLCSVETDAKAASVIAATLANGGTCPITGERVVSDEAVRNTLSLMHSCGMYDYSGQFAFKVGLPAKSGVGGAILLVVPNVMGICTWSPSLDRMGNSARGVQFCEELVSIFNFHNYDNLAHTYKKLDPRMRVKDNNANFVKNVLFGAANGDVTAIRRFAMLGMNMGAADYDGRTALHLACAEGHLNVVRLLLEKCAVNHEPKDRWGHAPIEDAIRFGHDDIVEYIDGYEEGLARGWKPKPQLGAFSSSSPPKI